MADQVKRLGWGSQIPEPESHDEDDAGSMGMDVARMEREDSKMAIICCSKPSTVEMIVCFDYLERME